MKKTLSSLIAFVLALVMAMSALPVGAAAATSYKSNNNDFEASAEYGAKYVELATECHDLQQDCAHCKSGAVHPAYTEGYDGMGPQKITGGKRDFKWPVPAYHNIKSCFYDRRNHRGIDIAAPKTPIIAMYAGTVKKVVYGGSPDYYGDGYGNYVVLEHSYTTSSGSKITLYSKYAHMYSIAVSQGQSVNAGQTIGQVGTSGNSTGYHLHFEIHYGGWNSKEYSIDPYSNYLLELPSDITCTDSLPCGPTYLALVREKYGAGNSNPSTDSTDPTQYTIPTGYLNQGSSGTGVKWLQACLCQTGYSLAVDGQFGPTTVSKLKAFQKAYGLTVDGGFGPQVRNKMLELLTCPKPTASWTYVSNGTKINMSYSPGTFTGGGNIICNSTTFTNTTSASTVVTSAGNYTIKVSKACRYTSEAVTLSVPVTTFTVTFKDWNGTVLKTQTVYQTGSATAPANPSRTGYTFTGWDRSFTNVTSNLTVNAVYSINTYTVTFKNWDGTTIKTQTVNYGGAATAPANPTRTGYTFTGWDRAFNNVTSNLTVNAQFTINTYTVTFKNWDGTTLKTQTVNHGSAATAPANPTRPGYTFTGWDRAFNNVTSNLTVNAQYSINTYTVTFKDWDGTTLKTQTVNYGGAATAPANPSRPGYTFTGWDMAFNNVTSNLTVNAQYSINTYTVTFKDWDGTVLKAQTVNHGSGATAPEDPVRTGYTFAGWDKEFGNVTADLVVNAQYEIDTYTVSFVDWDGTSLKEETVNYGGAATAPADPSREGYAFIGWDNDFSCVTEDMTVTAQYEEIPVTPTPEPIVTPDPTAPQIVVSSASAMAGSTVTMDVSLLNNPGIVSMALTVDFDERLTLVSVTDTGLLPGQVHSPTMGNPYTLFWSNDTALENYVVDGVLATLTFEIPEDMPVGEYPITISYDLDNYDIYNCDVETVEFAVVNGKVNVIDVLIGDVNTDTKVNNLDKLVFTRFLAKWADYPESVINMIAADVNVDTKVNNLDKLILTRHLARWAGYETLPYTAKSAPDAKKAEIKGEEPTIIVDSVTAEPGETVTVNVSLANNPGIVSMSLTMAFDPMLELVAVNDTGLLPGKVHSPTLGNPYTLFWANDTALENYVVNGSLVALTFKLSENAEPGTYPITITYDLDNYDIYNCDVELVEFAVVNGGVTYQPEEPTTHTVTFIDPITGEVIAEVEVEHGEAAEAPEVPAHTWYSFSGWDADFSEVTEDIIVTAQYAELGDVNGDGTVDISDALAYMRWLIRAETVDEAIETDFNGDGESNLFDALLLMRRVLGTI